MDYRITKEESGNFNIGDSIWIIGYGCDIDEFIKIHEYEIVGKLVDKGVKYFAKSPHHQGAPIEVFDLNLPERWYKSKLDALNNLLEHTLGIKSKVDSKISSILNMINVEKTPTTTIVVDSKCFTPPLENDKLYR